MEIPVFRTKVASKKTSEHVMQAQMVATTEFVSRQSLEKPSIFWKVLLTVITLNIGTS